MTDLLTFRGMLERAQVPFTSRKHSTDGVEDGTEFMIKNDMLTTVYTYFLFDRADQLWQVGIFK